MSNWTLEEGQAGLEMPEEWVGRTLEFLRPSSERAL